MSEISTPHIPTHFSHQEWKSGKSSNFASARPYEKEPPPPPPGHGEVDPTAYPMRLVKLDFDVNPSKKGWDKIKLSIPPATRGRHLEDPVFGPTWKELLADFDSKHFGLTIQTT